MLVSFHFEYEKGHKYLKARKRKQYYYIQKGTQTLGNDYGLSETDMAAAYTQLGCGWKEEVGPYEMSLIFGLGCFC